MQRRGSGDHQRRRGRRPVEKPLSSVLRPKLMSPTGRAALLVLVCCCAFVPMASAVQYFELVDSLVSPRGDSAFGDSLAASAAAGVAVVGSGSGAATVYRFEGGSTQACMRSPSEGGRG